MRVLVMAAQKGGSGKTTLATSLAVAAVQDGETVVVIDLDPQGSLREWHERREADDIICRAVEAAGLDDLIAKIRAWGKVSLVIIDTPGAFNATVIAALRQADLTLLPVRPSLLDVRATQRTAGALDQLERDYAFVLNQVQAVSGTRAEDAARALVNTGMLYPDSLGLRTDHLDAMNAAEGVTEWRPRSAAADEVRALWAWAKKRMDETPDE